MRRMVLAVVLSVVPAALRAQAPAAPDTAAQRVAAVNAARNRAAWLSDRLPLRTGDLITIVVDEQTAARERTSLAAQKNRRQDVDLNVSANPANVLGPTKEFSTALGATSKEGGEATRTGDLTGILTVHVTAVDAMGNATVEGAKTVTVDGRKTELRLTGKVRADDVRPGNLVESSRVADAVLEYKGKKMAPQQGILGKILSILWP